MCRDEVATTLCPLLSLGHSTGSYNMNIKRSALSCIGAVALVASATSVQAAPLGLDIGNGGVTFNSDIATNLMLGWEFSLSAARSVTGLGYWDEGSNGLLESHLVGIWDTAGTLLVSGTVDNGDGAIASASSSGRWLVDQLATSVLLGPGTYRIGGLSTLSPFDEIRQGVPIFTDSALAWVGARFIRDAGFADPTLNAGTATNRYFGPTLMLADLQVPEPSSLLLILAALPIAGLRRRAA